MDRVECGAATALKALLSASKLLLTS